MNEIKRYVKERDEMLLNCSVAELRTFVNNNAEHFNLLFIDGINRADDKVLEITLHKMIIHCVNLPYEFRKKSAEWLLERGFNLDI